MTENLIHWTDRLASLLAHNPGVSSVTITFEAGGRLHVDSDGARFVAKGTTLDIDAALAEEAYEVTA